MRHLAAAFPSACGKTNLAMLEPTVPGWKVETVGDDIAWMRFGDGRSAARDQPRGRLLRRRPRHRPEDQRERRSSTLCGNCIFTNVALTDDGDVWWEGLTDEPPAHLIDWKGRDWTPESPEPSAHPNAPLHRAGRAVPVDRRQLGGPGRACRSTRSCSAAAAPPTSRWSTSPSTGSTASSSARRSPPSRPPRPRARSASCAATRSRCCRSAATTWPTTGATGSTSARPPTPDKLPRIYQVNWFRKDADGRFLWPGFGENSRVLEWVDPPARGQGRRGRRPRSGLRRRRVR